MYKKHVASFWTAEEVDLSQDGFDWQTQLMDKEATKFGEELEDDDEVPVTESAGLLSGGSCSGRNGAVRRRGQSFAGW